MGKKKSKSDRTRLSIAEILDFCLLAIKRNLLLLICVSVALWLIGKGETRLSNLIFDHWLQQKLSPGHPKHMPMQLYLSAEYWLRWSASNIIFALWISLTGLGTSKLSLLICRGERPSFSSWYLAYRLYWRFLVATVLSYILFVAGFACLIIPGVIWGIRYCLSGLIVLDQGLKPVESLKESRRIMTRQAFWTIFLLGLMYLCLLVAYYLLRRYLHSVPSALTDFLLGLVTTPFIWVSGGYIYLTLSGQKPEIANG